MSSQVESLYQDESGEMYLRRKLKEWYSSDQPKHNCDGRGRGGRLLPTYDTFKFQLAATSKDKLQRLWEKNCRRMKAWKDQPDRPREAAKVGLFIGAPGIGKTRTLLELKTILPCGENYIYVSFNGKTSYSPMEKHATFDQMVAVRILWGSFELWNPTFRFKQWVQKFDYGKPFSCIDCLEIIRKEEGPFCLAIDEVTKLNEMAQQASDEITTLVLDSPIIMFLGGTLRTDWESALRRSNVPSKFLSLAPLNDDQVSNILDKLQPPYAQYFQGWRINTLLRDLLLQIGGVPRLLYDFVSECHDKFENSPTPWDWRRMDGSLEKIATDPVLDPDILNRLVKDIILRKQVNRKGIVIERQPSTTYDRLQSEGFIQLLPGDPNLYFVFVPFVRFRQWVKMLEDNTAFSDLSQLMKRKVQWGYWIEFENVTAEYLRLLIHLWSEEAMQNPQNLPTWEKFFTTSIPGWPNDIEFIHKSPFVVTSAHQFPKCGSEITEPQHLKTHAFDNGFVYVNASGASFADVFFTCLHGKEREKCLVGIQYKLFHRTTVTTKIIEAEVQKNEDAMENNLKTFGDCRTLYTVLPVTVPYNREDISESMEVEYMEIDEPNEFRNYIVQKFFPRPLRDYTFRAMCGRLNVNCAPMNDVVKLLKLDNNQAAEFAETRLNTGGFASEDDLPFEIEQDQLALIEF